MHALEAANVGRTSGHPSQCAPLSSLLHIVTL